MPAIQITLQNASKIVIILGPTQLAFERGCGSRRPPRTFISAHPWRLCRHGWAETRILWSSNPSKPPNRVTPTFIHDNPMPRVSQSAVPVYPNIDAALYSLNVDDLKWYLAALPGSVPTRKPELVAALKQALLEPA